MVITAAGVTLGINYLPPPDTAITQATVEPGSVAHIDLILYWSNWCKADPGPLTASITLPHAGGMMTVPFNGPPDYNYIPRCDDTAQPSAVQVLGYTRI